MKKSELLAPAGSLESLYAAISNGATSVYFGGSYFNARMYANNFNYDEIKEAIYYSHLRNVKLFVTLNILIKDSEIEEVKKYINDLYLLGIDGIIIQDYGILNFVLENYNDFLISCSTQTTIDDLEGVLYFEKLRVNRVVLARECSLDTIKKIKENSNIQIEVFSHGALCVSYSGQCLLSSYIGNRSGNRGKCAQPCRKKYQLTNTNSNEIITQNDFILSLKDLKTIDNLDQLLDLQIDSLKLEGRMKNPEYVANIVKNYRLYLDNYYSNKRIDLVTINKNLRKTFHRDFTNGYIFKDEIKNMKSKKNNFGYLIGEVTNTNYKGYIEISLNTRLNQNDIIRFDINEEVSMKLVRLYDHNLKLVNTCENKAYIKINEKIPLKTKVYRTLDYKYDMELKNSFPMDNFRVPLNIYLNARLNSNLEIKVESCNHSISYQGNLIQKSINSPINKEKITHQLSKLNNTPYYLNKINIEMDENIFINIKELNELRRNALLLLEKEVLKIKRKDKELIKLNNLTIKKEKLELSFKVHTLEQYNYIKEIGYSNIYYEHNSSTKINNDYNLNSQIILAKNYGSLYKYSDKDLIVDYSLNVYNHLSLYYLYKHGAKIIAPSIELSTNEFINLYNNFKKEYNEEPQLEFVAYSNPELMISKYCPLRVFNQCSKCKNNIYELNDEYEDFLLYTDNKCQMHLLSKDKLNKIKDISLIKNYSKRIRLEFFNESNEEIKKIIDEVNHQL